MAKIKKSLYVTLIVIAVLLLALLSTYTVAYPQTAVVVKQFGQIKSIKTTPGPVFRIPFLQSFEKVNTSTQVYKSNPSVVLTKDRRMLVSSSTITYRISDINTYLLTIKTPKAAESRVEDVVFELAKNIFAKYAFNEVITNPSGSQSNVQDKIIDELNRSAKEKIKGYGLEIENVLIPNLSYPKENLDAIYKTITSERQKVAAEIESQGLREANEIRAEFNKEAALLENETQLYEKSATAKGLAEAEEIYDEMYKTDSSFYQYYRTIKMYEKLAQEKGEDLVITIPADSPVGKVLMGN